MTFSLLVFITNFLDQEYLLADPTAAAEHTNLCVLTLPSHC